MLLVGMMLSGAICAETVSIAGHRFVVVDYIAAKKGSGNWPRAYDPKTGQYLASRSISAMKHLKRGGGGLPMVYNPQNGQYLTPAIEAAQNAASASRAARSIAAATGAGLSFVIAYEGVLYWEENPTLRDFSYCRISRSISIIFGTEIYAPDC